MRPISCDNVEFTYVENFAYDAAIEEFDDRIGNIFRKAFDGIKFYRALHYTINDTTVI